MKHKHTIPGASQMTSGCDEHTHPSMRPCLGSDLNIANLLRFEVQDYRSTVLRRRALVITDTEEKLMAAAAMTGLRRMPVQG
jgi:hypothetical protein